MKEISELTDDDSDWVESLVTTLSTLGVSTEPVSLDEFLEDSRRTWPLRSSDPRPLINLIGAGVGDHLASRLALRWVSVTDRRRQRLALYGESSKTLAFPMDAVARRWAGEQGSLVQYVYATSAAITQIRSGLAG
jgi:Domain of unknown function (DUF3806)